MAMIQLKLAKNEKLYVAFIDVSQAFDSLPHPTLWKELEKLGVSPEFLRIYKYVYSHTTATVQSTQGLTGKIRIQKGVARIFSTFSWKNFQAN